MKYLATFLLAMVVITSIAQKKRQKSNPADEVPKVKAAIENETRAFFEIDYDTWASSWAHVPYAYWSFADTTDVNYFSGWEEIQGGFENYFNTAKKTEAKIIRKWLEIRVSGNLAYARFSQRVEDDIERDPQAETRVLEKINGVWKVVHVGVIARQKVQD